MAESKTGKKTKKQLPRIEWIVLLFPPFGVDAAAVYAAARDDG